ncbi:ATP-dependent zinc protease family protein [Sporocytophaga myxococcoides]|uniref:ATP-dependent zinc protease family protein n=1 Tax=Sporocytophaga myxococcoides TaxID=153721 RepID=UPI00041FB918|nr:RimK/LysX family protein [Sporocytophaga myxococcoides]
MKKEKLTIGRSDIIDLPDLKIFKVKAKVDTGAYSCSIHCSDPKVTGKLRKKLSFTLPYFNGKQKEKVVFQTSDFSERTVKSSFGQVEKRFVIKTKVLVFNKLIETEFTLSDRSNMKHPILLGRKFLMNGFLVDVSKFNLSYKHKRKSLNK